MTRCQNVVIALLVLVAVLLALNLVGIRPTNAMAQITAGPTDPSPKVIAGQVTTAGQGYEVYIYRWWDDGTVDRSRIDASSGCTPTNLCGPANLLVGSCIADVSPHDGDVNVQDLLALLAQWGPCKG